MTDIFEKEGIVYGATKNQPTSKGVDIFEIEGINATPIKASSFDAIDISNPTNVDAQQIKQTVDDYKNQLKVIGQSRFTQDELNGFENNPISFWESGRFIEKSDILPYGDFADLAEATKIKLLAEKKSSGQEISQDEQGYINKYIDKEIEMGLRGFTLGGQIAYGVAQVPAFMLEFMATTPIAGGARKLVGKTGVKIMQGKAAQALIGTTARIAAMPQMYSKGYAERRLNDFTTITDKGELILKESEESPAKSALMALGYTSAEVASELSGVAIGKYVLNPVTKTLKTPLVSALNKLPTNLKNNLYKAYLKIQPNATISKAFTNAGWNGMIAELGEERVADILRASVGLVGEKDYTAKDYLDAITPDAEQLLVEAGIIGITGGVKTSASMAFNLLRKKGLSEPEAKEVAESMSAIELDNFVEYNLSVPQSKLADIEDISTTYQNQMLEYLKSDTFDQYQEGIPYKNIYTSLAVGEVVDSLKGERFFIEPEIGGAPEVIGFKGNFPQWAKEMGVTRDYVNNVYEKMQEGKKLGSKEKQVAEVLVGRAEEILSQDVMAYKQELDDYGIDYQDLSNDEVIEIMKEIKGAEDYNYIENSNNIIKQTPEYELSQQQLKSIEKKEPPKIINEQSTFNKFYTDWVNEYKPLEDLQEVAKSRGKNLKDTQDFKLIVAEYSGIVGQINQMIQVATFEKDVNGNNIITGKGLKPILDDFDNYFITIEPKQKQRKQDFEDYLIARRYIQDLQSKENVKITEQQKQKSLEDLVKLSQKYGNDIEMFQTFAGEIYEFQKRILKLLVNSGILAESQFNDITKNNKNYIPFNRILESDVFNAVTNNGLFKDANPKKIIKKIKGSDKEIRNVFQNIIANTAKIVDFSARNNMANRIASYADIMPEYVQKYNQPIIKKGTAKIKVVEDAGLRKKLEAAIDLFSNKLKKEKSVKIKTEKNVLGSYSPSEKIIRLKLGSNEGVLAHEVGHMIDYAVGLKKKLLGNEVLESFDSVRVELQELAKERLGFDVTIEKVEGKAQLIEALKETTNDKYLKYIQNDREIIANFFEVYVFARDALKQKAPNALKKFEEILDTNPEYNFLRDITPSTSKTETEIEQDVYGKSDFVPNDAITVYKGGKKEFYKVSRPILDAVNNMSSVQLNFIEKIFQTSATILRTGATIIPEFWIRNVLRDQQTAMLQSGVKYNPRLFLQGLFSALKQDKLFDEWQRSGGQFNSYMELDDKGLQNAYKELLSDNGKIAKYLKNPIKFLEDISMKFEQATRIGVFKGAKESGVSDIRASYLAKEGTLNFARRGKLGKNINRYIPFFNAGVQGVDKMLRTFKTNPKLVATIGLATITMPSLVITGYYLYGADDEERKEFLEIPEWKKDLFWNFKVGNQWVSYPKPFSYGYIFGSLPEKVLISAYDGQKPEGEALWRELIIGLGGTVSPVYDITAVIPPIMKSAIEATTNYNFFMDRSIYPSYMENLPPEDRYNKFNTETAKLLGKTFGVSPAIIDNTIRGTIASSATYVTGATDRIINQVKKWNGEDTPEKPSSLVDYPILRAFLSKDFIGSNSVSVTNFYNNREKFTQINSKYRNLIGEEKINFYQENRTEINAYKPFLKYNKQISTIRKQIDAIFLDKKLDGDTKADKIKILDKQITDIAREANLYYSNLK